MPVSEKSKVALNLISEHFANSITVNNVNCQNMNTKTQKMWH